jgi:hypothetical protein
MTHGIKLRNNTGRKHIFVYAADLRAERFGSYPELGNDVDERADAAFQREEFIQDHNFSLFKDAIAALKIPSFVAYDVSCFVKDPFNLIKRVLSVFHGRDILLKVTTWKVHRKIQVFLLVIRMTGMIISSILMPPC